jgi:uncharacterized surface protein with fasciclin (FAS1) repeats
MKIIKHSSSKYWVLILLVLTVLSCKHEDIRLQNPNEVLRPAAEFIHNNFNFSLFYAAIERAGLVEELNSRGPYTIFAPADNAFRAIGIRKPQDFNRLSPDSLKKIIRLHVIPRKLSISDVSIETVDNRYVNLAGQELSVSRKLNTAINLNGATTRSAEITVNNGIFYEIDKVLNFEDLPVRSWLEKKGNYSILIAGLKHFGLWELLLDNKQWTIMAPADSLFEQQGITQASISQMDRNLYGKRLFAAYIFPARFFYSDLFFFRDRYTSRYDGQSRAISYVFSGILGDEKFSNGISENEELFVVETFPLNVEPEPIKTINMSAIQLPRDLSCRNGVIHQIDNLILLPQDALKI